LLMPRSFKSGVTGRDPALWSPWPLWRSPRSAISRSSSPPRSSVSFAYRAPESARRGGRSGGRSK
jgi:hypothetical protein